MRIGLVTCQKKPLLTESEQLLIPIFKSKGHSAEPVVWDDASVNWMYYDGLIIRSIWDYHLKASVFDDWLNQLEALSMKVLNPIELIRKNKNKRYLLDLQKQGVVIAPTVFQKKTHSLDLSFLRELSWEKFVIKPTISASAYLTKLFNADAIDEVEREYKVFAIDRDFLIQEFIPEIKTSGELSLIFFNRIYSHSVLKMPKADEFRVQEDFGGVTERYQPTDSIVQSAKKILSCFEGQILYARVDGVLKEGQFILMEVELIEPELFLVYKSQSYEKFVDAALDLL